MNLRTKQIIFVGLVIILVAGMFFYKQKFGHWPWRTGKVDNGQPSITGSPSQDNSSSVVPQEKTQREKIMEDLTQKIAQLSDEEPVLGGHWFVDRFWFIKDSDKDLYVEYEDGHVLRRILLKASEKAGGFTYEVIARFEPGESDWVLKSGKDEQFGKGLDLYEFDESKNSWVKRN